MNAGVRLEIGDAVVSANGAVQGIVRYFTGDGKYAFVKDTDGEFHKLLIGHLSKVQRSSKVEEEHDGDGL